MIYLLLFAEFFKIGLLTIGGGLASLPFLYELAEKYGWFTAEQVADMVAIAESTPGPIAINMATFAGYQAAGVPGGIIATTGLVLPELCISLLVCGALAHWARSQVLADAFAGLRPAVAGLISAVTINLICLAILGISVPTWPLPAPNIKALILFSLLLLAVFKLKAHPIIYVLIGAAAGILFKF